MTPEEFAARVEKLITDAQDEGLSNDDIITELDGLLTSMKEDD